jgi:TfoX/Sxy family transcriptional regulator of competence genes
VAQSPRLGSVNNRRGRLFHLLERGEYAVAYDKAIEAIIQALHVGEKDLASKRMFGGVCYLVDGNMAFGIYKDNLIIRLGSPEQAQQEIDSGRALPFDITGKAMKGWVMVPKTMLAGPNDYKKWLDRGLAFAKSLPSK